MRSRNNWEFLLHTPTPAGRRLPCCSRGGRRAAPPASLWGHDEGTLGDWNSSVATRLLKGAGKSDCPPPLSEERGFGQKVSCTELDMLRNSEDVLEGNVPWVTGRKGLLKEDQGVTPDSTWSSRVA